MKRSIADVRHPLLASVLAVATLLAAARADAQRVPVRVVNATAQPICGVAVVPRGGRAVSVTRRPLGAGAAVDVGLPAGPYRPVFAGCARRLLRPPLAFVARRPVQLVVLRGPVPPSVTLDRRVPVLAVHLPTRGGPPLASARQNPPQAGSRAIGVRAPSRRDAPPRARGGAIRASVELLQNGDDCRALVARDESLCDSQDCHGLIGGDESLCDSQDCHGLLAGDESLCDSQDCRGLVARDESLCESGDCRGIVARDPSLCDSAGCRAYVSGDSSLCP